jgi:hypothetical protein
VDKKKLRERMEDSLTMEMIVTEAKKIKDLVNAIHDAYFDVDQIVFNESKKFVLMRFEVDPKRLKASPSSKTFYLRIEKVLKLNFEDTEKIGVYDVNTLKYTDNNKEIILSCGIPFLMKTKVKELRLCLWNPK